MEQDLTLTGAECVETLPERSQGPITLPSARIAGQSGCDRLNEILITERLCQKLYGAALHRLHGHRDVGVRCDKDNRHLPICRGKVALKLKTTSPRHSHVEYEAGRAVRGIALQEIRNGRKFLGMQADCPQQPPDRGAKLGIIIDDQHAWSIVTHPGPAS